MFSNTLSLKYQDSAYEEIFYFCNMESTVFNCFTCQWGSIYNDSNASAVACSQTVRCQVNTHVAGNCSGDGGHL